MADGAHALAQRAQDQPACPWCDAWPGAGAGFAPRLLGAVGAQRARAAAAAALQREAGIAPVTERSGKKSWGPWRLPGPTCRRHTWGEWAAESTRPALGAQVDSPQQRDQGQAQQAAVRALACP
jgi:transposase IS116/IS110/IS902 family protein